MSSANVNYFVDVWRHGLGLRGYVFLAVLSPLPMIFFYLNGAGVRNIFFHNDRLDLVFVSILFMVVFLIIGLIREKQIQKRKLRLHLK